MTKLGRVGRGTLYTTVGLVARAVIQAGYLLCLSRWMGAAGYGLFSGSIAMAVVLAPLGGWGVTYLISKRVARAAELANSVWASALFQFLVSGLLLSTLVVVISGCLLAERLPLVPMSLLAIAEVMLLPINQGATTLLLARNNSALAAAFTCLTPMCRLVSAVVLFLFTPRLTPANVAIAHFAGSVAAIAVIFLLFSSLGLSPSWRRRFPVGQITREGTSYALGGLVGVSYSEVDKIFLLQLVGTVATGTYTAAYRVASVFVLPITALVGVALPIMFGMESHAKLKALLKKMTGVSLTYALIAGIVCIAISPFMPEIFGHDFHASSRYLTMLAPWGVVLCAHLCAATALTVLGQQKYRVAIEAIGLVVIVGMNYFLLPDMGPAASVIALLTGETLMAIGCWWRLASIGMAKRTGDVAVPPDQESV